MSLIAIFSDVHGNLPALEAVLQDIKQRNVDQVYCLGDLVDFAPWPNEVIAIMRELRIPCLMGNHDERIAFDHPVVPLKKHSEDETHARIIAINHTKKTVTSRNKEYLFNLPQQIRLTFMLNGTPVNILLVHGSVNSNDEYIYEDHDLHALKTMMAKEQADVLVMGHTHISYIRKVQETAAGTQKLAINCGSVGRSKEGQPLATYVLLNIANDQISAKLIKLEYPVRDTFEAIRQSEIPDFYSDFLLSIKHS